MTYPREPGWKEGDTSREAAEDIAFRVSRLRRLVYGFIEGEYLFNRLPPTADEIARALDESVLTIRPRVSELRVRGYITNLGRGVNRSGRPAHRWVVTNKAFIPEPEND